MASLHKPSEHRILGVSDVGNVLLTSFQSLVVEAESMDCPVMDMIVTYIEESDEFEAGTYVPELHLVVRKVDA